MGWLQWLVLRRPFPSISRRAWVSATVIGAVVAWFFGSLPSPLMNMGEATGEAPMQEPPIVMLLAAAMGLALGVILAYPQWRVLRKVVAECTAWRYSD